MDINSILKANLGESKCKLKASFRKTINTAQYETEVIEATQEIEIDFGMPQIIRGCINQLLQANVELQVYTELASKGIITSEAYATEKHNIENYVLAYENKARGLIGNEAFDQYVHMYEMQVKE